MIQQQVSSPFIDRFCAESSPTILFLITAADEAMAELNCVKSNNSAVLLADGAEFNQENQTGSLSYTELSGLVTELFKGIRFHRDMFLSDSKNEDQPIPPYPGIRHHVVYHQEKLKAKKSASSQPATKGSGDGLARVKHEDHADAKITSAK